MPSPPGSRSRIVPEGELAGPVTLGGTDVNIVVTEHGIADLRAVVGEGRAELLAAVAAPPFGAELLNHYARQREPE